MFCAAQLQIGKTTGFICLKKLWNPPLNFDLNNIFLIY